MKIAFHKMVSAGNDFIVIDHRKKRVASVPDLARKFCKLHYGVGADGVVLIEKSKKADLRMRIYNADGGEAEMCGNATRCVALYANRALRLGKRLELETKSGIVTTQIVGPRVRSRFMPPSDYRSESRLQVNGKAYPFYFVNTGVPHVVIFTKGLKDFPVFETGRSIRYHERFSPKGANVNFVEVRNRHALDIRTYERGVENETLACGTGSAAAAIVSGLKGFCRPPVTVRTKSGENLTVRFNHSRFQVEDLTVEGPARFVFEGELSREA